MTATGQVRFDLSAPLASARLVLEASAGTGKTYSLTNLAVRHVVEQGVLPDQLLVVTYTRAAAAELRDRMRAALESARSVLVSGNVPAEHPWMHVLVEASAREIDARAARACDALTRFDDATITTIHGFCQQALASAGLRAGNDPDAVLVESSDDLVAEVVRDVLVDALADDPSALSFREKNGTVRSNPKQIENNLLATIKALIANPGAELVPPLGCDEVADRWVRVVERARRELRTRQDARRQIGYDRLVTDLHDALVDPDSGADLAQQLAARFAVVLVDEFQDTDRTQWEIFERAFPGRTVVTVGDPKQAIYRFRGADVHAYLSAVSTSVRHVLPVNHRSDVRLLLGLERLFDGATLGDDRIAFSPVQAAPGAVRSALGDVPAVQLRMVPQHPELMTADGKALAMPLVRQVVLADLAARIVHLLDCDEITERDGRLRRVAPGDIAVLVPSHTEAANVAEALRRAKVPAVRTRTGSVLDTPAVLQWRLLLAALARPHHGPTVRAAALGWFFAADPSTLVGARAEKTVAGLQEQCAVHAERMRAAGVAATYDALKSTRQLVRSVVSRDGGDRDLADLDHIGELLAARTHRGNTEPAQVLRLLEEMIVSSDERSEEMMRRIDSDAAAVQITTVHGAKGLEYPIVFAPFAFKCRSDVNKPYSFVGGSDRRTIDIASLVPWTHGSSSLASRKRLADEGVDGDGLRLLYVALTRARHRVELWWACATRWQSSPLARLLLDRDDPAGPVLNSARPDKARANWKPPYQDLSIDGAQDLVRRVAAASGGTVELTEIRERVGAVEWAPGTVDDPPELHLAPTHGRVAVGDEAWRRWSFTALTRRMADSEASAHDPAATGSPVTGGTDEPSADLDAAAPLPSNGAAGFADVVGGTRFGTFVHSVLEHVDFCAADLDGELSEHVSRIARREAVHVDVPTVVAGLATAIASPLGPMFAGRALRDIARDDRLDELAFDIPLASSRFGAADIATVLLETLDADDPVRPTLPAIADGLDGVDIAGWMYGSIDAVVRMRTEAGDSQRFVVIDYKSNRLHPPGVPDPLAWYSGEPLVAAMASHHYPLQAVLYLVALHRYLRWRLGRGYDPDVHLGGAAYLFLRGMQGGAGVFAWRPATRAVVALDGLLALGSAA